MHCSKFSKFYRFIGVATRHTESVRKWDRTPISLSHAKAVTLDESHLIQAQTPARADLRSVQTSRALIPAHICMHRLRRHSKVFECHRHRAAAHKASLLINFSPNKAYRRDESVISSHSRLSAHLVWARGTTPTGAKPRHVEHVASDFFLHKFYKLNTHVVFIVVTLVLMNSFGSINYRKFTDRWGEQKCIFYFKPFLSAHLITNF